jgi:6-phosphogluconolactonase/glucosamine-6-phosphate isomerase/deaminase
MHHEQQMESSERYHLPNHHPSRTATAAKDIAMFDPAAVESSSAATAPAAAAAHGYLPTAHAPQQWDGLDQMMLGVGGDGDLNDILSLEF